MAVRHKRISATPAKWDHVVRKIYREVSGSNPRKALMTANFAVNQATKEKALDALPRLILGRAHAYRESGKYREALSDYNASARLFRKTGRIAESWRTVIGKMDALDLMGRYHDALSVGSKASRYFRQANLPLWEAKIYANTGNIYQHLDRYELALKYYLKAYPILSRENPLDGFILLFNQATTYLSLGRPDEAIQLLERCRVYFDEQNLKSFLARAHYNLAYGFFLLGKYQDALSHLASASLMLRKLRDQSFLASCYLDEAELYLRLNRIDEALPKARRARQKFKTLNMPYEVAECEALLGIALLRSGKISNALPSLKTARTFFTANKNRVKSAELDSHLAVAFLRKNDHAKAQFYLKRAYAVFKAAGIHSRMISSLTNLANIDIQQGHPRSALEILNKADRLIRNVELPWVLFPYYQTLGRAGLMLGKKSARKDLIKAIRFAESMRSEIPAEDLRISFLEDKLTPYNLLVESGLNEGTVEGSRLAYITSERARSRVLMDLLEGSLGFNAGSRISASIQAELNLLQKGKWLGIGGVSQSPSKSLERERKIVKLLRESQVMRKGPAVVETIAVESVQSNLRPNQAMLSYYKIENVIHAFVLDRDSLTSFPAIALESDLAPVWQFLRFHLERGRVDPERSIRDCESHLTSLGEKLIKPVYEKLKNRKLITIVPHGWLHAFPFHCLRDSEGYLAERFQFSYAPSASVYLHCAQQGYADPADHNPILIGHSDSDAPWIDAEIREIHKLFPAASLYLGAAALSDALKENSRDAELIHIASHGRFLPDQPLFSGVLLADGWLTLPEIYQLKLNARLIALSGCETGTHQISAGDELVGLTRGFLYAGASSLLVSLWRVFDLSTAFFMKQFYSELISGKSRIESWQSAVIRTKERWPHPYFWGPFLLIGKP